MKHLMELAWAGVAILCLGQTDVFARAGEAVDVNRVREVLEICRRVAATDDPGQATSDRETVQTFLETHEVVVNAQQPASAKDLFDALTSRSAGAKEVRIRFDQAREYRWFEVSVAGGQVGVRELPLVEFRTDNRGLGLLRWRCCSGGAINQVKKSLEGAPALKGLFVDLRGNPGGHLVEALSFADQFLPRDTEMLRLADSVEDLQEGRFSQVFRARVEPVYRFPVVFITDGATASTAEAMVAVFRANWIGVSIGRPSKGDAFAYWGRESRAQATRGSVGLISVPNFPIYHNKGIEPDNPTSRDIRAETLFANADHYYAAVDRLGGSGTPCPQSEPSPAETQPGVTDRVCESLHKGTPYDSALYKACVLLAQFAVSPPTE